MSKPVNSRVAARRAVEAAARSQRRLTDAYKRVLWDGRATADDKRLVREDLAAFCNVNGNMLAVRDTIQLAGNVGMFRVWQRIVGMSFPRKRPADAGAMGQQIVNRETGGIDGYDFDRTAQEGRPGAGPGIAERTDD